VGAVAVAVGIFNAALIPGTPFDEPPKIVWIAD